jgi:hypothetical protein
VTQQREVLEDEREQQQQHSIITTSFKSERVREEHGEGASHDAWKQELKGE